MYRPFRRTGKFSWIQIVALFLVLAHTSLGAYWNILFYVKKIGLCLILEACHCKIWVLDKNQKKAREWASKPDIFKSYRLRTLLVLLSNKPGHWLSLCLGGDKPRVPFWGAGPWSLRAGGSCPGRVGAAGASCRCRGEIQPLSTMSFVPLTYLEFSMISEMRFTSETGLSVCGSVRNRYIAIWCLTFNVHCK